MSALKWVAIVVLVLLLELFIAGAPAAAVWFYRDAKEAAELAEARGQIREREEAIEQAFQERDRAIAQAQSAQAQLRRQRQEIRDADTTVNDWAAQPVPDAVADRVRLAAEAQR